MKYKLMSEWKPQYTVEELLLTNRGIPYEEVHHYLNTTDQDLHNPYLLGNIEFAGEMLIRHLDNKSNICIIVDSDADGFTSAALLINYIFHLKGKEFVEEYIKYVFHKGKQHGIELDILPERMDLLIVPDAGSNDYYQHDILHERGIDVIVIDHHEADKMSETAIVVNNQFYDYPNKGLCGVGVVYKFCQVLDDLLEIKYADLFLDLVAIGLVGDMMSLLDFETKHLVELGLNKIRNPFIKALSIANSFSLGKEITPIGVTFYIVPFINSMNRSGTQEEKELLFAGMLEHRAHDKLPSEKRGRKAGDIEILVDQAVRVCKNVKNRQTRDQDSSLGIVDDMVISQNLLDNKIILIKLEDVEVDKNLRGLIANKLMGKYKRPVMIVSKQEATEDGEACWSGSARGHGLKDFRALVNDTELVEYAQGHANAFGVCIPDSEMDNFIEQTNEELKDFDFDTAYEVDFEIENKEIKASSILKVAALKPIWGQNLPEPLIVLKNMVISKNNIELRSPDKSPTLIIKYTDDIEIIKFKSSKEEYQELLEAAGDGYAEITIIGRCDINEWNGNIKAQVILKEFEVQKQMKYYF